MPLRRRSVVIACLLLVVSVCALTGCEPHLRYRVVSTLFDGVPDPDAPKKAPPNTAKTAALSDKEKGDKPPEPVVYKHPAAEGKDDCSFCHGITKSSVLPPKDICLRCHEHLKDNRPFLHGPAVVDCVVCHNPHEGSTKTLVRKVAPALCFDCHDKDAVMKAGPHEDLKGDELVCTSCHDPHGGKDKFFLRS